MLSEEEEGVEAEGRVEEESEVGKGGAWANAVSAISSVLSERFGSEGTEKVVGEGASVLSEKGGSRGSRRWVGGSVVGFGLGAEGGSSLSFFFFFFFFFFSSFFLGSEVGEGGAREDAVFF